MIHEQLLHEFDSQLPALNECKQQLQRELIELLSANGIEIHYVSARVKSRESLRYKLSRPDKTYQSLSDVTDLLGLRITTYFEDTIEHVAKLIEKHFRVDFGHSSDKLKFKDHGRFGYRSLHYVCATKASTNNFRFEIQIRTILQHAWAEVEHDLGYKANGLVPDVIRRRFSRIASLLEIADEEFVSIRRDLESYELSVKGRLADPLEPVPVDGVSLHSLVESVDVRELDQAVAILLGKDLSSEVFFPEYLIKMLNLAGLHTTRDIVQALAKLRSRTVEIVPLYFEFTRKTWQLTASNIEWVYRGYSLFFLAHVLILESSQLDINKVSKFAQFYRELDYPNDEASAQSVASGLFAALAQPGTSTRN